MGSAGRGPYLGGRGGLNWEGSLIGGRGGALFGRGGGGPECRNSADGKLQARLEKNDIRYIKITSSHRLIEAQLRASFKPLNTIEVL